MICENCLKELKENEGVSLSANDETYLLCDLCAFPNKVLTEPEDWEAIDCLQGGMCGVEENNEEY